MGARRGKTIYKAHSANPKLLRSAARWQGPYPPRFTPKPKAGALPLEAAAARLPAKQPERKEGR